MKVRRVVAIVSILAGTGYKFGPMVWHKVAAKPALASVATANPVATTNLVALKNSPVIKASGCDLGVISLTNHYETSVPLGAGKKCILSPQMLDSHNVRLTLTVEAKSASGKTHDLSVTQVVTLAGKPFEVAVGNYNLSLTPNITAE